MEGGWLTTLRFLEGVYRWDRNKRGWYPGNVMEASRQCQQHILLNQKQPRAIPHTGRREELVMKHWRGNRVARDGHRVGVSEGGDDLTGGIAEVDR